MMRRRHGQGTTIVTYGTSGGGQAFVGNTAGEEASEKGRLSLGLFSEFMNDFYSQSSKQTETVTAPIINENDWSTGTNSMETEVPRSNASTDVINITPATSSANTTSAVYSAVATSLANATAASTSPVGDAFTSPIDETTVNSPAITTVVSSPTNTNTTSLNSPANTTSLKSLANTTFAVNSAAATSPANTDVTSPVNTYAATLSSRPPFRDIVFYKQGPTTVATGLRHAERKAIHGHPIPPHHECVEITWVEGNVDAPFVLGDPDENGSLVKGQYFALPMENLVAATILTFT